MTAQTITVDVPESLYEQLRERALRHQRSVADEVLELLINAVPASDILPEDLEQAIAPLELLDDAALWPLARSHMSVEAADRLKELNLKRQREGLSEAEAYESELLVHEYERAMLIRAR